MENCSRREMLGLLGASAAAVAFPGWLRAAVGDAPARVALQLYSIRTYIGGRKDKSGKVIAPGVGLEKALADVRAIGYQGIEFAGYYGFDAGKLKAMLDANGLVACGTHIGRNELAPEAIAKTCEFNLACGNDLLICPGGGNVPTGATGAIGRDGKSVIMTAQQEDFTRRICDFYNQAAIDAAKYGCRVGLHNHTWEHKLLFRDGTSYWDYFFSHTDARVCMEQDVGWTTCAGLEPCAQFVKYPHRSPTIHAKENGMGPAVKSFDAILGKPGEPGAVPVDWDRLLKATAQDGVGWYVVECERHEDDLSAVKPSYEFLKSKGLS